jgi:steroid Delta-isomerase
MSTEAEKRHVYERWHEMIEARNATGLMELYTEDCVLESSAILVLEKDESGTLKGKKAVGAHFEHFFRMIGPKGERDWYRPGPFFSDGKVLVWEYPSKSPTGDQLDVVESMDIANGLIAYHRVYWGWMGFKALLDALNK